MGQSASTQKEVDYSNAPTLGYRVLGVQPNSPASDAGLVSFFDFLVGSNGRMLFGGGGDDDDDDVDDNNEDVAEEAGDIDFVGLLQDHIGKPVELLVFNIKSQETRLCYMTPSTNWGGSGLLGVTIRVDSYANAEENLLRVLFVEDNSPAQVAGLKPESDYLLGTQSASFSTSDILYQVLIHNEDKVLEIYVYNAESDIVRVVNIMPTYSWGGRGLLGAEVGSGYLHRIPKNRCDSTGSSLQKDGTINESKGTAITLSYAPRKQLNSSQQHRNNGHMNISEPSTTPQIHEDNFVSPEATEEELIHGSTTQIQAHLAPETQVEEPILESNIVPPNNNNNIDPETTPTSQSNQILPSSNETPEQEFRTIDESRPEEELPSVVSGDDDAPNPNEEEEEEQNIDQIDNDPQPSHYQANASPLPPSTTSSGFLPPPPISGPTKVSSSTTSSAAASSGGLFSSFLPPPPFFSRTVEADSGDD